MGQSSMTSACPRLDPDVRLLLLTAALETEIKLVNIHFSAVPSRQSRHQDLRHCVSRHGSRNRIHQEKALMACAGDDQSSA